MHIRLFILLIASAIASSAVARDVYDYGDTTVVVEEVIDVIESDSITDMFIDAPLRAFPLLPAGNTRLDMVDYYLSGMTTPTTNARGGKSAITHVGQGTMTIAMTDASTYQFFTLPVAKSETDKAIITTYATPIADSRIVVYSPDWSKIITDKVFREPSLADWLTPAGRKARREVEQLVPFLLTEYAYDPASTTLTITNRTFENLSQEDMALAHKYMRERILMKWNGKKFVNAK